MCLLIPLSHVGWVGLSQGLPSCTPLSYVSTHPIVPHRMVGLSQGLPSCTPLSYVSTHPIVPHRMGRTVPRTPIMYIPILCVYLPHRMCRTVPSTPLCTIMYTSHSIVPRRMSRTVPRTPLCTIMHTPILCVYMYLITLSHTGWVGLSLGLDSLGYHLSHRYSILVDSFMMGIIVDHCTA